MPARPTTVAAATRLINLAHGLTCTATLLWIEELMQRPWMVHGAR